MYKDFKIKFCVILVGLNVLYLGEISLNCFNMFFLNSVVMFKFLGIVLFV